MMEERGGGEKRVKPSVKHKKRLNFKTAVLLPGLHS